MYYTNRYTCLCIYSLGGVRARPLSRAYTADKTPRTQKSNASLCFIVFCSSSLCWSHRGKWKQHSWHSATINYIHHLYRYSKAENIYKHTHTHHTPDLPPRITGKVNVGLDVGNSGRSLHSRSLFSNSRSNRLQTCAVFWHTIQLSTHKNQVSRNVRWLLYGLKHHTYQKSAMFLCPDTPLMVGWRTSDSFFAY